jgi:hypothetical protein
MIASQVTQMLRRAKSSHREEIRRGVTTPKRHDPFHGRPLARAFHNEEIPTLNTEGSEAEMYAYQLAYCTKRAAQEVPLEENKPSVKYLFLFIGVFFLSWAVGMYIVTLFVSIPAQAFSVTVDLGILCSMVVPLFYFIRDRRKYNLRKAGHPARIDRHFNKLMRLTSWKETPLEDYQGHVPAQVLTNAQAISDATGKKVQHDVLYFDKDPYMRATLGKEVFYFAHW